MSIIRRAYRVFKNKPLVVSGVIKLGQTVKVPTSYAIFLFFEVATVKVEMDVKKF